MVKGLLRSGVSRLDLRRVRMKLLGRAHGASREYPQPGALHTQPGGPSAKGLHPSISGLGRFSWIALNLLLRHAEYKNPGPARQVISPTGNFHPPC